MTKQNFDNKICHLTYTHSDYADIWPIYFTQMKRFWDKEIEHCVAIDGQEDLLPANVSPIIYDDSLPYPKRLLSVLERLKEFDYVFFDHEDMLLYSEPDHKELKIYYSSMVAGNFDYIRMIKAEGSINKVAHGIPSLYCIDLQSKWIFSIQPSFWKRKALIKILEENSNINIWEFELKSQKAVKKLKLKAAFSHRKGAKRGLHHYDNNVYPYIATAIVKGKWNLVEYPNELGKLLLEHNINPKLRGISQ